MKQIRVLQVNLSRTGKVGAALRSLLQSAPGLSYRCAQESIDFLSPAGPNAIKDMALSLSPDVLILTARPGELSRFRPIYESLGATGAGIPAIAFMESNDLSNITAVFLQTGAILTIPDHLTSLDIASLVTGLSEGIEPALLAAHVREGTTPKQLIGESAAFLDEIRKIPIIAKYNSSVLIWGETGTGKEICAQMIHFHSPRAANPFIPVNCGAIPVDIAENELFGHTRGAFTGAVPSKPGLIREAESGTLFLDEVDSLPPLLQVKLLRFLQEKTYRPLGSTRELPADVRTIAATNIDPDQALRTGRLRQDLYYRLNVLSLRLPPLRERKEDISLLARHFLDKNASETFKALDGISAQALQRLQLHDWPGNVRELERVIERAVVLCSGRIIEENDIQLPQRHPAENGGSFKEIKERYVEQFEKSYIEKLLLIHHGNISKAAQAAQKHRRAFWQLIRKYGIDADKFRAKKQI